jgi:hypothetical protein
MRVLDISKTLITEKGLLATAGSFPVLESLALSDTRIDGHGIVAFSNQNFGNLSYLGIHLFLHKSLQLEILAGHRFQLTSL